MTEVSPNPWQRFLARGPTEVFLIGLAAAAWLYLLVLTRGRLLEATAWTVPFVIVITVATWPWRTVSARYIGAFFMLGMGPVFLLVAVSQVALSASPLDDWLRRLLDVVDITNIRQEVWAPVTEEALKLLPLIVFLWWRRSGLAATAGPLDYAAIAGASGAGMGFSEDLLRLMAQEFSGPSSSWQAFGLGRIYANLVGSDPDLLSLSGRSRFTNLMSFFFPEMHDAAGVVWTGHGALSFGVGLAIGIGVWESRRLSNRLVGLGPWFVFLWAVFEHFMANWYRGAGCGRTVSPLCLTATTDLHGRLFPLAVLAGFFYAARLSRQAIQALHDADPILTTLPHKTTPSGAGWRPRLQAIGERFRYRRLVRAVAYGTVRLGSAQQHTHAQVLTVLGARTRALTVAASRADGWDGTPTPTQASLEALTPMV